ncbi:unnamed protein product, partial [Pylaiella littoralis]
LDLTWENSAAREWLGDALERTQSCAASTWQSLRSFEYCRAMRYRAGWSARASWVLMMRATRRLGEAKDGFFVSGVWKTIVGAFNGDDEINCR